MILDRWYRPTENELVYHYCRPEAFLDIIRSRSLWLSASYTLNDARERSWGYSVFAKALNTLEQELGKEFVRKCAEPVIAADSFGVIMLACFSLDADVLSQWRAYADNGRGFAIGFSLNVMQVPAKALRVIYEENDQLNEIINNMRHVYKVERSIGFKYGEEFQSHMFHIGADLCAYKHRAFREEQEIRLAHACGIDRNSNKIISLGARASDGTILCEPVKTQFRMSNGVLVPYVIIDYSSKHTVNPIKEIVLGPRNDNAELNIDVFLSSIDLSGITVRRSTAPYLG